MGGSGRPKASRARRLAAAAAGVAAAAFVLGAGPSASAERAAPPSPPRSSIGPVTKEHNVPGADGRLWLRLHVPATIRGERGHALAMGVWFADERGQLVRPTMPEYADAGGALKVESVTFVVRFDPAEREFVLALPYAAFPRRPGVARYKVEARAKLVRRSDPQGTVASTTTSFWVEQEPPLPPPAPDAPAPPEPPAPETPTE
jgi:hypothetical protein